MVRTSLRAAWSWWSVVALLGGCVDFSGPLHPPADAEVGADTASPSDDVLPDVPSDHAQDAPSDVALDGGVDAPADLPTPRDVAPEATTDVVSGCDGGQTLCAGECASLQTDPRHCGRCGRACAGTERCVAGTCALGCPSGQTACTAEGGSVRCVSTDSDVMNCGACGVACAAGQRCASGRCAAPCATGLTPCGTACVNLQSDPGNCGACGTACGMATVCGAGTCQATCPAGQTVCSGGCHDLQRDGAHCGACGRACAAPEHGIASCSLGICAVTCSEGYTLRVGECVPVSPPRLVSPLSGSFLTSRRPTFSWALASGSDSAQLDVCEDRACTRVERTVDATGSRTALIADLSPGVHFWRARSRSGITVGGTSSATWEFVVPARTAVGATTTLGLLPDYNGDGAPDAAVGAPDARHLTEPTSPPWGYVYVYMNTGMELPTTVAATLNNTGLSHEPGFGRSVAAAGDVNGDGYPDLAVASQTTVWLFQGGPSGVAAVPLSSLVSLTSPTVGGLGDVNGDGYADLLVLTGSNARVYVGSATGLATTPSRNFTADYVSGVGDLNGDGYADVVSVRGRYADVYQGGPMGATLVHTFLHSAAGITPTSLSGAGDLNGDGYGEFLVGVSSGRVLVFRGAATGAPSQLVSLTPSLADRLSCFGCGVSGAGDLNGDGFGDVVATTGGMAAAILGPSVYVFHGSPTGPSTSPNLTLTSSSRTDRYGLAAGSVGDVNGDGYCDLLVGARDASPGGSVNYYVGGPTGLMEPAAVTYTTGSSGAGLGAALARAW